LVPFGDLAHSSYFLAYQNPIFLDPESFTALPEGEKLGGPGRSPRSPGENATQKRQRKAQRRDRCASNAATAVHPSGAMIVS